MIEMQRRPRRPERRNGKAGLRVSLPLLGVAAVGILWLGAIFAGWLG